MIDHFRAIGQKIWWVVDLCFSRALDDINITEAQDKCLNLDAQATNILISALSDKVFEEVMDIADIHDIWKKLQALYGDSNFIDDDGQAIGGVEQIDEMVLIEDCSTSSSSDANDLSTTSSLDDAMCSC